MASLFETHGAMRSQPIPTPKGVKSVQHPKSFDNDIESLMVSLQPFSHQVGGHGSLLRVQHERGDKVCKPLVNREREFYESMKDFPELKPFTPNFYGVVDVLYEYGPDNELNMQLKADPSSSLFKHFSSPVEEDVESESDAEDKDKSGSPDFKSFVTDSEVGSPLNPWSLHCFQAHMHKVQARFQQHHYVQRFIVLEDLTSKFRHPCILDLKMGQRQHGIDSTPEKAARQMKKCKASTSYELGVRVCGMQVYKAETGMFLCRDKYHGRSLNVVTIKDCLAEFLKNDTRPRYELLPHLLEKLRSLRKIIEGLKSYRFYSSSLLVIYEGDANINSSFVDVRMIDFAHSYCDTESQLPDYGQILGLDSLIRMFSEIYDSRHTDL
eukprot:Colp12_sorted_trinity150504_noHs@2320